MKNITDNFLLARDISIYEVHLRQPTFTYNVSGPFTKNWTRVQTLQKIGGSRYSCRNEIDKTCFQNDIAYGDVTDLSEGTASDKVFRNKAVRIGSYFEYDRYQLDWHQCFDKKVEQARTGISYTQELGNELHTPMNL